jgi:hypothetical protein
MKTLLIRFFQPVLIFLVICSSLILSGVVETAHATEEQLDLTVSIQTTCADVQFNIQWPESSPGGGDGFASGVITVEEEDGLV